jgi:hypothetical protein
MTTQHVLNFRGCDVRTAADDQILFARYKPQLAVLALPHEIAGREPAIDFRILNPTGAFPVTDREARPFNVQLADLTVRHRDTLIGDKADFHARHNAADRSSPQAIGKGASL